MKKVSPFLSTEHVFATIGKTPSAELSAPKILGAYLMRAGVLDKPFYTKDAKGANPQPVTYRHALKQLQAVYDAPMTITKGKLLNNICNFGDKQNSLNQNPKVEALIKYCNSFQDHKLPLSTSRQGKVEDLVSAIENSEAIDLDTFEL